MSSNDAFQYLTKRALTLGSGSQLLFIKREYEENNIKKERIIPVLALTDVNQSNNSRDFNIITSSEANGEIGVVTTRLDDSNKLITTIQESIEINPIQSEHSDWLVLDHDTDTVVYPRIFIKSLQVKTNSDALVLKYEDEEHLKSEQIINYVPLKEYEEYSVLTRSLDQQYVLTLKPEVVVKKGAYGTIDGSIATRQATLNYTISNADTSIYLDAIEVLKENAMPKVEYDVKPNVFATEYCETLYNKLGNIIRINDNELKFKNIRGYISGLTLDLDNPDEDTIEVKNYKTKFEDLFSTITAQTEAMKKNNGLMQSVAAAFTSSGELSETVLQSSIRKVDLDYAFNNGKLTIDEHNGIWGTSDTGVVAFRGGGIFTATEKNTQGNWKWNTGITPEGINADLITTGQLDTNLIKIYSGDNVRFQMNGDGIFAYKNQTTNAKQNYSDDAPQETITADNAIDSLQYVRFYDEGLVLVAKKGAKVLNHNATDYITVLQNNYEFSEIKRVEIGWKGLILRNWDNQDVFYADADTGNLTLTGRIIATSGKIGAWNIDNNKIWAASEVTNETYTTFVALNAGGELVDSTDANGQTLQVPTNDYAFWAGSPDPTKARFSIQKNGTLKATEGLIGGWTLTPNYLYRQGSVVLVPGGQDGGTSQTPIDIGENQTDTLIKNLNGTVIWAPGPTINPNDTRPMDQIMKASLQAATFTVTKSGDLTAASINGCNAEWFKGATFSSFYVSDHQLHWKKILPSGRTITGNFNGANGVKSKITKLTIELTKNNKYNDYITAEAIAAYADGTEIESSSSTDRVWMPVTCGWSGSQPTAFKRVLNIYIGGYVAKQITISSDSDGTINYS